MHALRLQTCEIPRLEGVGGNPVPTLGGAEVVVEIGARGYNTPVVVSARKERPSFIIQAYFLDALEYDLSQQQKCFTISTWLPGKNSCRNSLVHLDSPYNVLFVISCKNLSILHGL